MDKRSNVIAFSLGFVLGTKVDMISCFICAALGLLVGATGAWAIAGVTLLSK